MGAPWHCIVFNAAVLFAVLLDLLPSGED